MSNASAAMPDLTIREIKGEMTQKKKRKGGKTASKDCVYCMKNFDQLPGTNQLNNDFSNEAAARVRAFPKKNTQKCSAKKNL